MNAVTLILEEEENLLHEKRGPHTREEPGNEVDSKGNVKILDCVYDRSSSSDGCGLF